MTDRAKRVQTFVHNITTSPGALSRQNVTKAFELITSAVFSRDEGDINDGLDALFVLTSQLEKHAR